MNDTHRWITAHLSSGSSNVPRCTGDFDLLTSSTTPSSLFRTIIAYDTFDDKTVLRNFSIRFGNQKLYVNSGYCAELSERLRFIVRSGAKSMDVDTKELSVDDAIATFQVLFYCPKRKPLDLINVVSVYKGATYFRIPILMKRCESLIFRSIPTMNIHQVFDCTKVLSKYDRKSPTLPALIQKLAGVDESAVGNMNFLELPEFVVAKIHAVRRSRDLALVPLKRRRRSFFCFFF